MRYSYYEMESLWWTEPIYVMVSMALSLFLLFLFFSSKRSVASAKNITSSLLSISRCRNWSPALLKPSTSWGREAEWVKLAVQQGPQNGYRWNIHTLISRTLEIVFVLSSSMTDRSIWLLVICPKWILQQNTKNKRDCWLHVQCLFLILFIFTDILKYWLLITGLVSFKQ